LLAPSDAELMGGLRPDGAADDAADEGGADDAGAIEGGMCLAAGLFCNGDPTKCCSHTCNAAGGRKCD
jgi:hypothetical protein